MDKKTKEIIKEVIDDILKIRKTQLMQDTISEHPFVYRDNEEVQKEMRARRKKRTIEIFDMPLVKLNKLLEKEEQYQEILEIEKQMAKIQAKKYITTKECAEIYNRSISSQRDARGRIHDPLPYYQTVAGGKVMYVAEEVEEWLRRNDTGRHSKAKRSV